MWNTILHEVDDVVETILTKGILEPKEIPYLGSGSKLFRFIAGDYWIFSDKNVVKVVAKLGDSDKEQVLLLDTRSINAKMKSNKELSSPETTVQETVVEFIGSRLQMNSKGELILIETSNDALCDTDLKVTEYKGISHIYTTKIPVSPNVVSHPAPIDIEEFSKTSKDIEGNLHTVRRKSLEAEDIHANIISTIANIKAHEA